MSHRESYLGSSREQHVALNAADGTKCEELSYSYENGMHTFSIPLKEDDQSTRRNCSQDKSHFPNDPVKSNKAPLQYHLYHIQQIMLHLYATRKV